MIKRNPTSRNQRSKGFKVKHVLQVILLLGVCFWLIYQVKHNHDKKKEFDKNDMKLPIRTETDQILKLGRKDLHPGKVEADKNEKHEEEEEDEHIVDNMQNKREHDEQQQEGEEGNKHETEEESEDNVHEGREEQDEEENKHGAEEQEENESKSEEVEDEGGDVEIDENDHEKSEADNDRDDEVVDEEKDKEEEGDDETENEDKEDEEKVGLVENHDNHEAREEHYKADDASSAVAHDTHETSTETGNLEHSDLSLQNTRKPENETNHSDESNGSQNGSDLKVTEGELTDGISSNATAGKDTGNDSFSNETAKTNPDSQLDLSSNLTAVITEASSNSTGTGDDTSSSSEQIKAVILSESDHAQNATVNTTITGDIKQTEGLEQSGSKISEGNLPGNDSIVSVKPESRVAAPEEYSSLGASALEKTIGFVASNVTDNVSSNLNRNASSDATESDKSKGSTETSEANETQNIDATEDEMFKGDTQTSETDEKSDTSSVIEILDSIEHDTIDSSDTQNIHEDMAKARTDLDTLPDIRNEGNDSDENAAE